MSRFYFGGSDTSSNASSDDLPYPVPLPRSAFLTPDFSPTTYLSTLRNRHQTLEDLRAELRSRSQDLSKELLDLVNTNYQDFLNLGGSLKGGEEKVEEVRLGLLGFRRDVDSVRQRVSEREQETGRLIGERAQTRRQIGVARALLEISARLEELEARLMVDADDKRQDRYRPDALSSGEEEARDETTTFDISSSDESDGPDDDDDADDASPHPTGLISTRRLRRLVQQYVVLHHLVDKTGPEHPFIRAQDSRLMRVRNTLLLDLGTALKAARAVGERKVAQDRVVQLMAIYREMDEAGEAVSLLKGRKS